MLLLSLSSSGELYFDGLAPDFHTELALTLDEDEELVRDTLEFLMRVHRLEQKSETVYYLPEVGAVTGSESASAERMRKARQKPADAKPQEPVQAPAEACDTEAAPVSYTHLKMRRQIFWQIVQKFRRQTWCLARDFWAICRKICKQIACKAVRRALCSVSLRQVIDK